MQVRVFWWWVAGGSLLVGCGGETTEPRPLARALSPIVSDAITVPVTAVTPGGVVLPASLAGTVVYVSLPPASVPRGRTLEIRNGRTGAERSAVLVQGGADPVAIDAEVGDALEVVATDSGGGRYEQVETVRARVAPRVVRTSPGPQKSDVPLNSIIQVVFSEPVTSQSAAAGIQLRQGATVVAGQVRVVAGNPVLMEFVPDEPLAPATVYTLELNLGILDLGGDALAEAVSSSFTTAAPPLPPPLPPPPGTWSPTVPAGIPPMLLVGDTNNVVYLTSTSGAVTPVVRSRSSDPRPAWSPDGQWVIYADTPEDDSLSVALFLVRPDGTGRTQFTPRGTSAWTPAWSPDGQAIAYGCDANGNAHLCLINADGTGARPLVSDGLQNRNPAWSPDGQQIAFHHLALDTQGEPDLHVMNADGSFRTRLLEGSRGTGAGGWLFGWWAPTWSPDGSRITFAAYQYLVAAGIHMQALDGSAPTLLIDEERYNDTYQYRLADPDWMRDGSRLAVLATRCDYWCDAREVWVFSSDGSQVLARIAGVHSPAWRP